MDLIYPIAASSASATHAAFRASATHTSAGGVQKPGKVNLAQDPAGTLGIDKGGFGFSKQNELTVGRVVSSVAGW